MDISSLSQESLWLITVVYDLGLALLLYRFFGKYGLYVAVVLGIVLGNLQGGKVSELIIFLIKGPEDACSPSERSFIPKKKIPRPPSTV